MYRQHPCEGFIRASERFTIYNSEPVRNISFILDPEETTIDDKERVLLLLPTLQRLRRFMIRDIEPKIILIQPPYVQRLDVLILFVKDPYHAPLQAGL